MSFELKVKGRLIVLHGFSGEKHAVEPAKLVVPPGHAMQDADSERAVNVPTGHGVNIVDAIPAQKLPAGHAIQGAPYTGLKNPSAQGAQLVEPAKAEDLPGEQTAQEGDDEEALNCPEGHMLQAEEPAAAYHPARHGVHEDCDVAPAEAEALPAAQTVHDDDAEALNCPEGQMLQAEEPAAAAYHPAGHGVHSPGAPHGDVNVPEAHKLHAQPGLDARHVLAATAPAGQANKHVAEPGRLAVPAGQRVHATCPRTFE